jgi:Protein of unknown function (DUF3995)
MLANTATRSSPAKHTAAREPERRRPSLSGSVVFGLRSFAGPAAAGALAALATLHAAWATGSAWPARDRRRLAQLVAGAEEMPSRASCTVVACALATSSALVARLGDDGSIARAACGVVCGAFLVRGGAGLTGSTQHLVSWTPAPEFVRRDRRCYGPLCLGIGVAVATTLTRD